MDRITAALKAASVSYSCASKSRQRPDARSALPPGTFTQGAAQSIVCCLCDHTQAAQLVEDTTAQCKVLHLVGALHKQRERLRPPNDVARYHGYGAKFAHGARVGQDHAIHQAPPYIWQRHVQEHLRKKSTTLTGAPASALARQPSCVPLRSHIGQRTLLAKQGITPATRWHRACAPPPPQPGPWPPILE